MRHFVHFVIEMFQIVQCEEWIFFLYRGMSESNVAFETKKLICSVSVLLKSSISAISLQCKKETGSENYPGNYRQMSQKYSKVKRKGSL